jgi:hypothetical protein
MRELAGRQAVDAGGSVYNLGQAQATGAFLDPNTNPALRATIEAATRPMYEAFERGRGQIASSAIAGGAYKGSSRRQLAEEQLLTDTQRNIGDTAAMIAYENLARERQIQQQTPEMIDAALRLQQLGPEILGQTGAGYRDLEQLLIEERLRQYEEAIEAPYRPLLPLANIVHGGNVGQLSQTTTTAGPGGFGGGITGALGGAAAGEALNQAGYGGGYNALLGALAGGIGGAMF